jgi:hypothetical protein
MEDAHTLATEPNNSKSLLFVVIPCRHVPLLDVVPLSLCCTVSQMSCKWTSTPYALVDLVP